MRQFRDRILSLAIMVCVIGVVLLFVGGVVSSVIIVHIGFGMLTLSVIILLINVAYIVW